MQPAAERPRTVFPEEKPTPYRRKFADRMAVSRPRYLLGFKDDVSGLTPQERFRRATLTGVLIDTILGKTSALYNELYDNGLIDASFGASYTAEDNFGHTMMGRRHGDAGETRRGDLCGVGKTRKKRHRRGGV